MLCIAGQFEDPAPRLEMVRFLLDRGADINFGNNVRPIIYLLLLELLVMMFFYYILLSSRRHAVYLMSTSYTMSMSMRAVAARCQTRLRTLCL